VDEAGLLGLVQKDGQHVSRGEFVSAVIERSAAGSIEAHWLERWTAPQTWKKYAKNPIFGPKQTGDWDDWTNGVCIVRNPDHRSYKMFYASRKGGIGFADASLDNPLVWKENPASPVLRADKSTWEGDTINQPRVVKVTDNHWRMYYTGWGYKGHGPNEWTFGLAESFDAGVTWKRCQAEPLLERGPPGSYDDGAVFVPEVRRIGDTWMMWYTALKLIPGRQAIHLCLATSNDGIHWVKSPANPILTDDFTTGPTRNVISRCFVRYDEGVFQLWYSHARPDYRIRYAESIDGVHFERSPIELALDASPKPAWDDQMVEYPTLDVLDGQWRLWFCGNGFGSVGFAEGVVETGMQLYIRSGEAAEPNDSWSAWKPLLRGKGIDAGKFAQFKAELWSKNERLTPKLQNFRVDGF
jgi:predicted GH43/DUF377 family glycosyl hydrolase